MLDHLDQNQFPFENMVRVRVCGILKKANKILLLKHRGIGEGGYLWSPPGGGVEFGQSLTETLKREFLEETCISVEVDEFLFANEHIDEKHHALEFFFNVRHISGELKLGYDPELPKDKQMLEEAKFFSFKELESLNKEYLHSAFHISKSLNPIEDRRGLITFKD